MKNLFFKLCVADKTSKIPIIGYGLGAALGLFSASVSPNITAPDAPQQTAREIFRDLKFSTLSYAKNFAVVGLMFSAVECTIESVSELVTFYFETLLQFFYFPVPRKGRLEKWNLCWRYYWRTNWFKSWT